jgi:hypothetical protein
MLYAVSYGRLSPWRLGKAKDGGRQYLKNFFVGANDFAAIEKGVLAALNITPK